MRLPFATELPISHLSIDIDLEAWLARNAAGAFRVERVADARGSTCHVCVAFGQRADFERFRRELTANGA